MKLYIDDKGVAEMVEISILLVRYSLAGEGLCIGYEGGDAVSRQYKTPFRFTGGGISKVIIDVAKDAYLNVAQHFAAALARD